MPSTVPTPVSAALGLLPTVLGGVRRLPAKAVQLPILALSSALNGMDLARREYDELSERGERLVARLRGQAEDRPADSAQEPKAAPTPKATQPHATRIDSAATPSVIAAVKAAAEQVTVDPHATHADLPLADYDHLTLGSLRGRLRSLDVEQLVQIRAYEKSKADRLPVVTMLDNRIAKLAAGQAKNDPAPHTKVRHT